MRLLDYFWGAKKKTKACSDKEVSGKCVELLRWNQYLNSIADSDHYISRREYRLKLHSIQKQ